MSEFDVEQASIAREIKRIYIEQKRLRVKNPKYSPDARNNSADVWMKAAAVCMGLGASPEDYVTAAFSYCSMPGGPFGTNMYGPSMKDWYQKYTVQNNSTWFSADEAKTPAEYELKNKMATLNSFLTRRVGTNDPENPAVIEELISPVYGLDPLACVMLAGDHQVVVDRHRQAVLDLLERRPDMVRTLKEMGYPMGLIMQ